MPYRISFTSIVLSEPVAFAGAVTPLPAGTYRLQTYEYYLIGETFTVFLSRRCTLHWVLDSGEQRRLQVDGPELDRARPLAPMVPPANQATGLKTRCGSKAPSREAEQDQAALDRAENEGMLA